ncbi:hypothetical protein KKC52_12610 [bacterium]|nr:hypothetical protein [bacterium]
MKLKNLGEYYRGFDGHTEIAVTAGETVDVSKKTADRLTEDFSSNWEIIVEKEAVAPVAEKINKIGGKKNG